MEHRLRGKTNREQGATPSQIPACMLAQRFFGIKENVLL